MFRAQMSQLKIAHCTEYPSSHLSLKVLLHQKHKYEHHILILPIDATHQDTCLITEHQYILFLLYFTYVKQVIIQLSGSPEIPNWLKRR